MPDLAVIAWAICFALVAVLIAQAQRQCRREQTCFDAGLQEGASVVDEAERAAWKAGWAAGWKDGAQQGYNYGREPWREDLEHVAAYVEEED